MLALKHNTDYLVVPVLGCKGLSVDQYSSSTNTDDYVKSHQYWISQDHCKVKPLYMSFRKIQHILPMNVNNKQFNIGLEDGGSAMNC